jgi:hypothetical protein
MTNVYELKTGKVLASYDLPPRRALVAAYNTFILKNNSTWDYDQREYQITEYPYALRLGDLWVIKLKWEKGEIKGKTRGPEKNISRKQHGRPGRNG